MSFCRKAVSRDFTDLKRRVIMYVTTIRNIGKGDEMFSYHAFPEHIMSASRHVAV